jgi:uncharacterized protein YegP (UPF0339 family)
LGKIELARAQCEGVELRVFELLLKWKPLHGIGQAAEHQSVGHRRVLSRAGKNSQMEEKMASAYKIRRASNNQFYFVLEAENGRTILSSEMYMRMESVMEGINSVRINSVVDERYIRKTENSGKPYFVLTAKNKEPIGTSEIYSSKEAMEKGVESVKQNGPTERVDDESGKKKTEY